MGADHRGPDARSSRDEYALDMTPPPLARDISWLHTRLDEAARARTLEDIETVRVIARRMLDTGTPDPALADLQPDRIDAMLKLLTIRFHLRNKAEQLHITRINRERELATSLELPRLDLSGLQLPGVSELRADRVEFIQRPGTLAVRAEVSLD